MGFYLTSCEQAKHDHSEVIDAEVVVYGGTSAAVTAAVELARSGNKVVLVAPDRHLGGMTSSGLGFTDTGNKEVIGGLAREFYQGVYNYYQQPETWKWQRKEDYGNKGQGTVAIDGAYRTMWIFEPSVAEKVFNDLVEAHGIPVYLDHWLDRQQGVGMKDQKITEISCLNGKTFRAEVFIDATYEGDLMAAAGVSYTVGREANQTYQETWNGVQTGVLHHGHHFGDMDISPFVEP